jgi:hypothetical protein
MCYVPLPGWVQPPYNSEYSEKSAIGTKKFSLQIIFEMTLLRISLVGSHVYSTCILLIDSVLVNSMEFHGLQTTET